MVDYFYAFVNEYISCTEFENWVYNSVDLLSRMLNNDLELFTELLECTYCSDNETAHLKHILRNKFSLSCTPENYDKFISSADESLKKLIENNEDNLKDIIFDCTGIDTPGKLQKRIQTVFKFPEWYGMNWDAFNDLIDLSDVCTVRIINIQEMQTSIQNDTELFLKLLQISLTENCKLIFE